MKLLVEMTSLLRRYATFEAHQRPTVGDTKTSVVSVDHLGWLKCDGRVLNVSEWRILFSIIGYSFGGSGSTFKLPSPAGRVMGIAGADPSGVLTTRAIGDISGTETHVLTVGEMPDHRHTITDPGHIHGITDTGHTHTLPFSGAALTGVGPADDVTQGGTGFSTNSSTTGITVNSNTTGITATNPTGGSGSTTSNQPGGLSVAANPHTNMQPTLFLGNLFIYSGIPTYGTWPVTTLGTNFDPLVQ